MQLNTKMKTTTQYHTAHRRLSNERRNRLIRLIRFPPLHSPLSPLLRLCTILTHSQSLAAFVMDNDQRKAIAPLVAGLSGGTVSTVLLLPLDNIKVSQKIAVTMF